MEAVVGAGEAFVVGHHQVGAELVVALADGFEDLALCGVCGIVGVGVEQGGGGGEGFEASRWSVLKIIFQ